ncbi:CynX/NimT family MFS transporter [Corynebacterium crudilactis]|uniref:Cyanate permease n=1 Tax=Corynebacterium crudilactis TaxID=1652495 RepID=A0A172QS61_9CORY|nr:CynX/NimT family MFS transporter [Corynebacterium crudilactis]ANE03526.1 cyanate permease [Corynebacterium crudilactis]
MPRTATKLKVFTFLAVLVAAFNLRSAIVSVGAVLDELVQAFDASGAIAGIITAIPGIAFGIFGVAAVPLAKKIGLSGALTSGMVVGLIGLAIRPWVGDIWAFIFLTGFVVMGIAIANILLPAWIKLHGGKNTVALMTVYTTVLGVGSTLGPLSTLLFNGSDAWRWAIFIWVIPAALQVVIWLPMWWNKKYDFPAQTVTIGSVAKIWTSPTAFFIMLFFGLQSMNAYIQMGWLPKIFIDAGVSPAHASIGLSIVGIMGIVGGITMPFAIARTRNKNLVWFPVVFGISMFLGYVGTWLWPAQGWFLWSFFLGFGGLCFPMAIALIPARTRDPRITASLSGFAQPVGYILAALGPLAVGAIYQALGSWSEILIGLALGTIVLSIVGFRAARNLMVDDELAIPN